MLCPFCQHRKDRVIESRESRGGYVIRRRRECLSCLRRYTTYERSEEIPHMVVKKDGRRERFNRSKILAGVLRACEKRPVPRKELDQIVERVERRLQSSQEGEVKTEVVGKLVMEQLKEIDKIAYVRFASVYREFRDVREFQDEVERLHKRQARNR